MRMGEDELIRELRETRPEIGPDFARRLDEWAAAGFPRGERPASARRTLLERALSLPDRISLPPARRLIAPAGAAATLVVVAGIAISQGGPEIDGTPGAREPQVLEGAGSGEPGDAGALDAPSQAKPSAGREAAGAEAPDATTLPAPVPPAEPPIEPGTRNRRVAQRADLRLAAEPEAVREVADGVNSVVNRYRGFVVDSSVTSGGDAVAAGASFDLRIPAAKLQPALADLSELAHVVSRTEGTEDITARFLSAEERIEEAEVRREGLLERLADADSAREKRAVEAQLRAVGAELRAARGEVAAAHERVRFVPVSVTILSEEGAGDGEWGVEEAIDDAGEILSAIAGALVVAAAILAPLALLGVLAWALRRRSIGRARDRALD